MRDELVKCRKRLNMTQEQVADLAGIERSTYAHIERGTRSPSLAVALSVAKVLQTDVQSLFLPSEVAHRHSPSQAGAVET